MNANVAVVSVVAFLVDFFLLLGIERFVTGIPVYSRIAAAAAVSGIYAGACLLPDFYFLGNILWRIVCLSIISVTAYGISRIALHKGVFYVLLNMALSGFLSLIGSRSVWSVAMAGGLILLLCLVGMWGVQELSKYVQVELRTGTKKICLTALRDTGNLLRDPVTGETVLVIGPESAMQLTGLSREQLASPIEAMISNPIPGLRLIPYHSVGNSGGMLLAMRLADVRIGQWQGSSLVAFAPNGIGSEETYQALAGGMVR